jgi:hypothetical protein
LRSLAIDRRAQRAREASTRTPSAAAIRIRSVRPNLVVSTLSD